MRDYVDEQIAEQRTAIKEVRDKAIRDCQRVTNIEQHYLSYKSLWKEWWKVAGVLVVAVSAGAGLAIAGAQWIK